MLKRKQLLNKTIAIAAALAVVSSSPKSIKYWVKFVLNSVKY